MVGREGVEWSHLDPDGSPYVVCGTDGSVTGPSVTYGYGNIANACNSGGYSGLEGDERAGLNLGREG